MKRNLTQNTYKSLRKRKTNSLFKCTRHEQVFFFLEVNHEKSVK